MTRPSQPADVNRPYEIAPRVWWVGGPLENDPFQCHSYLIENGADSILIDPGSPLTYDVVRRKSAEVVSLSDVRYVVCHHQDPDIAGALPLVARDVGDKAEIVTHWRVHTIVRHHDVDMPYYLIDRNGWELDAGGRRLKFVFTPYAHFPGAFCTFDEESGVLFSSDLFGGFTEKLQLFAEDESYFEQMKPFHEHYIPSREILLYALGQIASHPVQMIAPQHGSIVPGPLIPPIVERLSQLDCGIYLLARGDTEVHRLSRLNEALSDITHTMMQHRGFAEIARSLLAVTQRILPARSLTIYHQLEGGDALVFDERSRFSAVPETPPARAEALLGRDRSAWRQEHGTDFAIVAWPSVDDEPSQALIVPLFDLDQNVAHALAVFPISEPPDSGQDLAVLLEHLGAALQVAVEREVLYRQVDLERQRFYQRSIRDPLTGLFTRFYMDDTVGRLIKLHERDPSASVALALFDIDHFKQINDTYGHNQGDVILQKIASILRASVRESDIPVRLGGEEFAVFLVGSSSSRAPVVAERIRERVEEMRFGSPMEGHRLTISSGVARHEQGESLRDFIHRADEALYAAKSAGRNRVQVV